MEFLRLWPSPWLLAAAVTLDLLLGDPVYSAHPVRLIGRSLLLVEGALRRMGVDGYAGGILLFLILGLFWTSLICAIVLTLPHAFAFAFSIYVIYSLLALRDLLRHGWRVERAAAQNDLAAARAAIQMLVGRDTSKMDTAACRRAAIESLSENLTDGFISPIFWYALAGLPGLLVFKVVSTMDSMVGYKTERYLRFGWCGARLDDVMNWVPARIAWLLISLVALFIPQCSAWKALRIGWQQHAIVPGPNSGWSEAATAGAICRKLVGPIWADGALVTEMWLGDEDDPPAGAKGDFTRSAMLLIIAGLVTVTLAITALLLAY